MKPIIVNLPPFTIGLLNDNADYCINVGDKKCLVENYENVDLDCREILL